MAQNKPAKRVTIDTIAVRPSVTQVRKHTANIVLTRLTRLIQTSNTRDSTHCVSHWVYEVKTRSLQIVGILPPFVVQQRN